MTETCASYRPSEYHLSQCKICKMKEAAPQIAEALKAAMYQLELHAKRSGGDYILKQAETALKSAGIKA